MEKGEVSDVMEHMSREHPELGAIVFHLVADLGWQLTDPRKEALSSETFYRMVREKETEEALVAV